MTVMAEAGHDQYRRELIARPKALAGVRRTVCAYLRRWGFELLVDPVTLCVHELLSNVDKHTDSRACVLTLHRQPNGVRVVVSDSNTTGKDVWGEFRTPSQPGGAA